MAGFGLVALVSTLIGLYGLIAYTVSDRRREIGLRLALGADGRRVLEDVSLAAAALVLLATAGVAIWLPARRAATIDPASALRAE